MGSEVIADDLLVQRIVLNDQDVELFHSQPPYPTVSI
jgi:hypothetical protein